MWFGGFGTTANAFFMNGDADRDGNVDGNDFLLWQGTVTEQLPSAASAQVPEPGTHVLCLLTSVLGLSRGRLRVCFARE